MRNKGFYEKYIKRIFDLIASFIGLVILLPLLLFIAFLIKIKLGSPVLFKQDRPGLNNRIFKLYKFRTMSNQSDDKGQLLPDKIRLTKFGKFLRSTSLDELPELFNILKGDMSIVGPRPLLPQYLKFYRELENGRSEVRPGLTGLAQINGRNAIDWHDKFTLDLEYVNNISMLNDIKIIINTFFKIIARKNITFNNNQNIYEYFDERDEEIL